MKHKVYHLLTETEPFSEYRGGAISRWAANVLWADGDSTILCPSADESWGFPSDRVFVFPRYDRYQRISNYARRLPWTLLKEQIRYVLRSAAEHVGSGDILWVHNRPDYASALAPLVHRAGGKIVLHMHNSHLLRFPAQRIIKAALDHFVFVSHFLEDEAQKQFPFLTSSTVLHNGASEAMFYPPPIDRAPPAVPEILLASRLVKEKGPHVFLEAMRILQNTGVPAKGIVVGASRFGGSKSTGYIADLYKMAPSNVEFRPYCTGAELAQMFRNSDIFCAPSTWEEPFGMTNVEAFASGVPVVSTHGGGSKEVFAEGGGILVERGSAQQLANALKQLIDDPALRKRIASEGRSSFEKNFTWGVVQSRYRKIVSRLSS